MALPSKSKPAEGLLIGLLGAKPKKAEKEEHEPMELESEEEDTSPDYETMGQEVLDAIEAKDASALAESIKALVTACMTDESDGDE